MKQNVYKLWVLAFLLFTPYLSKAVTVTDSAAAANVQVCLKPEIVRLQFSVGGSGTTGSYLDIKLPAGFTWEGIAYGPIVTGGSGSNTMTYAGVVGGRHRITFGSSTASQTIKLGFWQKASCSAGTSSFTTRDSLFFYEGTGSINVSATNLFNGTAPDLSITSLSNSPEPSVAGSNVTRTYTITNGGFGATTNFRIIDDYFNGGISIHNTSFRINPSGVNYNISTSRINDNGDSAIIRFGPTEIQNIGDGDTLFENGESFILRYTFNTNSCGNGSNQFPGDVSVNWLCPSSVACATSTAIYTNSVTIPAAPSISTWGIAPSTFCAVGTNVDTVFIRNTGGLANNVVLTLNTTWNNVGLINNMGGYIDTLNIRFKRGRNGAPQRLFSNSSTVTTGTTCTSISGTSSGIAQVTLLPITINQNDTIILIVPRISTICRQSSCGTLAGIGYRGFSGLAIRGAFQNACQNQSFSLSANQVIPLRTYQHSFENNGNTDFTCGATGQLVYPINFLSTAFTKSKFAFRVQLPAQLSLNSVSGVTFYIQNGASVIYPERIIGDSIIFTNATIPQYFELGGSSLVVNVIGSSSLSYCSGLISVGLKSYYNPDTSSFCNSLYNMGCLSTFHNFYGCGTTCCADGFYTRSLTAYRENVGLKDNDNNINTFESGKADTTLISRNVFWHNDTLLIKTRAVVKTSSFSGFDYAYFKTGLASASSMWQHISTTVNHWGPSTSFNTVSISPAISGDSVIYDVSSLNTFVNNDTVELISRLKVDYFPVIGSGVYSSGSNLTYWYGSNVPNPSWSQRVGCNQLIVNTAVQFRTFVFNTSSRTVNGCSQIVTNHDFSLMPAQLSWPFELRPFKIPLNINLKMPTGYEIDSVVFQQRALAASPRYNMSFTITQDSLRINLSSLFQGFGGSLPAQNEHELSYMSIYWRPGCNTPSASIVGGARLTYFYPFWNKTESYSPPGSSPAYSLNTSMPSFTANSPAPIALQYSKQVSWEVTNTNLTAISAPNGFAYLRNNSGFIAVDSVKLGNSIITPNGNGFYSLGTYAGTAPNNAKTLRIYGTTTSCNLDSIEVFFGFNCTAIPTSFTNNICGNAFKLYVQPQAASIQTQITSLASTPKDPANPSAGNYGGTTIFMCRSIPFEMEIQSTQTGNIYNVSQSLTLPFNGASGLNYVSDSGYIEYPVGTTPRPFSSTANSALITQAATGSMTLSLNQIDPDTFNANRGLLGTGLGNNNTRRVILRWKMRSNCDLVSGDQWQATQSALSPCGSPATGSTTTTSGYSFDLDGVARPYIATVKVSTGLDGCGSQTTQIRLEKTGGAPPASTDSITVRLPKLVAAGTMTCSGVDCPGGSGSTQAYTVRNDATYQYITFQYPNSAGANGDTLLYSFPMTSRSKATCVNNQNLRADVFQQLTVYCGAPIPANLCPNAKLSLGSETKSFDIRKAILNFSSYSSDYVFPSSYKYKFNGTVSNTSTFVPANTGVTLKTFMDVNNNLTYEKGIDALVKTTVLSSSIPTSGSASFSDSFVNGSYPPSPSLPMYTVIDTGDASANCFCGGVVQSAFNQALPIEFISVKASNLNNINSKLQWKTNYDPSVLRFDVYRKLENETTWSKIGFMNSIKNNQNELNYNYYDKINQLNSGRIYYQIQAVKIQNSVLSQTVSVTKNNNISNNKVCVLSPNPAQNKVLISLNEGLVDAKVVITDINGKVMYNNQFNGVQTEIDLAEFAQGIYTIRVISNEISETHKLSVIK